MFVLGSTVNAFPDEVGNIPVVRFAQKLGVLKKQESKPQLEIKGKDSDDQKRVVRTKHFEEWMVHTSKASFCN